MTINMWQDFKTNGFVFGIYTFLRCMDTFTVLVLCQLIAEYNHANNENLNAGEYFLTDLNRLADYLGLEVETVKKSINELIALDFICTFDSGIENIVLVCVEEENIIKFKQEQEYHRMFHSWDWGLKRVQNPAHRSTHFEKSTLLLMSFVEQHLKNPETIPLCIYSFCNLVIKNYEITGKNFENIPEIGKNLYKIITDKNFVAEDLCDFVYKTCTIANNTSPYIDEIPFEDYEGGEE